MSTLKESEESILSETRYNGRINILDNPDPYIRFKMQEKIACKNKATEYREPLEGIMENSLLAQVYFSQGNVQILQNGIRAGVYSMSGYRKLIVPQQNIDNLKIIMRSIYLQYGQIDNSEHVTKQVEVLNEYVLDYAVLNVYNEAVAYLKYLSLIHI